jgi:hypothetical protein
MDLLPLLDIRVKLRDPLERQRIHQINLVRFVQMLFLESLDNHGKRGGKQEDLTGRREKGEDLVDYNLEFRRQEFVCFLQSLVGVPRTSMTKEVAWEKSAIPFPARSSIRPGVATMMCTGCPNRRISSCRQ